MIHGSARHVWHDAFDPKIKSMQIRTIGGARSANFDYRVHQGTVQNVIEKIRDQDEPAWAWGMMAYSPIDTHIRVGRGPVYEYLERRCTQRFRNLDIEQNRQKLRLLMFVAIRDAIIIDWGRPKKRREYVHMGRLIGVDAQTYSKKYHKYYLFMRDECLDLAGRALSPLAHFIELWLSKTQSDALPEINQIIYGRSA